LFDEPDNSSLTGVYFEGEAPSIGANVFYGDNTQGFNPAGNLHPVFAKRRRAFFIRRCKYRAMIPGKCMARGSDRQNRWLEVV